METKYIDKDIAETILATLERCKAVCPNVCFKVHDTEEYLLLTTHPEKVLEEMDGGDEIFTIYALDDCKTLGWFDVMPYEDVWSVFADFSDTEFCNLVMRS